MKKILIITALLFTAVQAVDIVCLPLGDGYMWCSDNNGNEWTVYTGE